MDNIDATADGVTTVLLIRHAHTDALGRVLTGRTPGVSLSAEGARQAARLAEVLTARVRLAAIYTSPLRRAIETAGRLAWRQRLPVHAHDQLLEMDFGEWTGRSFADLDTDAAWRRFNEHRSIAVTPGGEQIADAQARIVDAIGTLGSRHRGETIALVSHAELVRLAVLFYRAMSIDLHHRCEIAPASVTALALGAGRVRLEYVNSTLFSA
jgi:broad specificity phosphatase PhoE